METIEVSKALVDALFDAMDPEHKDNARYRTGDPVMTANIPASIWNRIRDELSRMDGCPVLDTDKFMTPRRGRFDFL